MKASSNPLRAPAAGPAAGAGNGPVEPAGDPGCAWMVAWQGGDEAAFDRLVEAYAPRLYALFTRFLGPVPGREDLVQEVFLRLVESRERYQPSARFSTYLYRIAFNLSSHERERERLRRTAPLVQHGGSAGDGGPARPPFERADERAPRPAEALEREDVVGAVRRAIALLPDAQRLALVLSKYEGMAHDEIAQVMGSTRMAVKSLVHRAREALRVSLAGYLEEETA